MDRHTVLKRTDCDLKRLPLGAVEAFVLSQLDGSMTLEEIAAIAGLDFAETARLARILTELGAASAVERKSSARRPGGAVEEDGRSARRDPRAEEVRTPKPSVRPKPRVTPEPRPARRPTRKSVKMQRPPPVPEVCELDDETQLTLAALDAKLAKLDHYGVLELDRTAERKAVKRAYFALAAKYHPDRFFGKKLGAARVTIERIFHRVTAAHDTLTDAETRAVYDASLPPLPKKTPEPRRPSRAMRMSSRRMQAVKPKTVAPPPKPKTVAPPPKPKTVAPPPKSKTVAPPPVVEPRSEERMRQLHTAAKEIKLQARIEMFMIAAEEALRADDPIGAANNYRLALEHREDPYVRGKLDEVDERAKSLRFTRSVAQARAAERDFRWADAAIHLVRANDTKPTAEIADRAANALRMSGGDLDRALELAEQATGLEPENAKYKDTLDAIYVALKRKQK